MKSQLKRAFVNFGGEFFLRKRNKTPRILFWHGVDLNPDPLIEAESIKKEDFLKQIDYLEKYFEIISTDEFYKRYNTDNFNGSEVVLTFDDGYKNNLKVLAPILKSRNLPFTVFITTNNISNGSLFPTSILRLVVFGSSLKYLTVPTLNQKFSLETLIDKKNVASQLSVILKTSKLSVVDQVCKDVLDNLSARELSDLLDKHSSIIPLTWDEVRELNSYGCTIGAHCLDHICCHENQDQNEVHNQILNSRLIIEKELNQSCDYFAYPNGDFTEYSKMCVKDSGYKLGFSTKKNRINSKEKQLQTMPRISVPYNFDTFQILFNLYPKKL